jgi:hypothetical protein
MLNWNAGGGEQYTAIIQCFTFHDSTAVSNAGTVILPSCEVFLVPIKKYIEDFSPHLENSQQVSTVTAMTRLQTE